jgi:dihydroneopterin aldolase
MALCLRGEKSARLKAIYLEGLEVQASIGVLSRERANKQKVVIDIAVAVDPRPHEKDSIDAVLDYRLLREAAVRRIDAGHIALQETLAEDLAAFLLTLPRVHAVHIRIGKPSAFLDCERVGCELLRFAESRS